MTKLVILDDVVEIRNSLAIRLQQEGYEVRTAANGEDAIDLAYLFKPDLLIADWNLQSDYDGLEVAEAFLSANDQIKTIIISGRASCLDELELSGEDDILTKYGLVGFLAKPFAISDLVEIVKETLAIDSPQSPHS